jgi:hypothetical protein
MAVAVVPGVMLQVDGAVRAGRRRDWSEQATVRVGADDDLDVVRLARVRDRRERTSERRAPASE